MLYRAALLLTILIQEPCLQFRCWQPTCFLFAKPFVAIVCDQIVDSIANEFWNGPKDLYPYPAFELLKHLYCRSRSRVNFLILVEYKRIEGIS